MSAVLFFIAAAGAITGAVGVVLLRDPFYSVLALVGHLIFLAVLFLLLRAEFVAAVQVVVYAGAVMVLYVFVVAYVGGREDRFELGHVGESVRSPGGSGTRVRVGGAIVGGALAIELLIALLGTGLEGVSGYGAGYRNGAQTFGTPAYIGKLLLTRFLLVFEVASLLLLIAAVGAVVLARRRRGLEGDQEDGELGAFELPAPPSTGTTAEGVGTLVARMQRAAAAPPARTPRPSGEPGR
jgi:NADH-quinone oxidoreductase subunit J